MEASHSERKKAESICGVNFVTNIYCHILLHTATATELTEGDLKSVLNEIHEARVRAYFVGLNLKIPTDKLESIKSQYGDNLEQLLYVIMEFLRQTNPKPTWWDIVGALKSPLVGMPELAEEIQAKFCSPSKPFTPKPDTGKGMYIILAH